MSSTRGEVQHPACTGSAVRSHQQLPHHLSLNKVLKVEDSSYLIDMGLYLPKGIFVPRTTLLHASHFLSHRIYRVEADTEIQKSTVDKILPLLDLMANLPSSSGTMGFYHPGWHLFSQHVAPQGCSGAEFLDP